MEMSGSTGGGIDGYADGSSIGFSFDVDSPMLEPYQRCRSNTWHGRARVDDRVADDDVRSNRVDSPAESCDSPPSFVALTADAAGGLGPARTAPRKPASRKNAWGNLSYADLITQAIESSPEKRLTLAQIYDWMVTNVPFFKDKGDSNSSAGWKVRLELEFLIIVISSLTSHKWVNMLTGSQCSEPSMDSDSQLT